MKEIKEKWIEALKIALSNKTKQFLSSSNYYTLVNPHDRERFFELIDEICEKYNINDTIDFQNTAVMYLIDFESQQQTGIITLNTPINTPITTPINTPSLPWYENVYCTTFTK